MVNNRLSRRPFLVVAFVLTCCCGTVSADVKLAGVFGDHMVLQRHKSVPVWGWAEPNERVVIAFNGQTKHATADANGKWLVRLDSMEAGGPYTLSISAKNKVEVNDVLIGDVWLCSGQSNMAMTVSRAKDFETEQKEANYPLIRHFKTAAKATPETQNDCQGTWAVCDSNNVAGFSATAYFFGRRLHQELNVPIGLINSSWGGTDVAAWTSLPAQQAVASIVPKLDKYDATIREYDPAKAKAEFDSKLAAWQTRAARAKEAGQAAPRRPTLAGDPSVHQNRPGNLFNGMIHPLIPFAIRGVTWYQGEHNSHSVADAKLYETELATLIADWRTRWENPKLQFLIVQLPNFHAKQEQPVQNTGWVVIRESQRNLSRKLEHVGIVVTTDVGEANDIHPKDKQSVGERLARYVLGEHGNHDGIYSGPQFVSHQSYSASKTGGMRVGFVLAKGLKTSDGQPVRGFAIAGEDRVFHHADAKLESGSGTVIVSSKEVPAPVAVRYNWADNPPGNLVNAAGLPAEPFRTDTWEITDE